MQKSYHTAPVFGCPSDDSKWSNRLKPQHLAEWKKSKVGEDIIALNVLSLDRDTALDYLLYSNNIPRDNNGRVSSWILNRYRHLYSDGWYVSGRDLIMGDRHIWGQVKFDCPRVDSMGKAIKYECPILIDPEYYALEVSDRINEAVTGQQDVEMWEYAIRNTQIPLYITEGAKKAGSLLDRGLLAIGLPGINSGYRDIEEKKELIKVLQLLAPRRKIIFAFDCNESPSTSVAVSKAMLQTGRLLKREKCKVFYLEWLNYKGIDDYFAICDDFPQMKPLNNKAVELHPQLNLNKVDTAVNEKHLTLDNCQLDWDADLIAIKSPKSTAKTTLMTKIAYSMKDRKILVASFRESLCITLASDFGIPYRRFIDPCIFSRGYSLCIDSLHSNANPKFDPSLWAGAIIFIDEVEQVVWHLLNSATCASERLQIINCLKELFNVVLTTGGKIIVADADLSSVSINFLSDLVAVPFKSQIIENLFSPLSKGIELFHYSESTPLLLIDRLARELKQGKKALLACGAAKVSSFYSTKSLCTLFKGLFPHLAIGILDSSVQLDCSVEEYLSLFDLAIVSSSIEAGISIEDNHFDSVWAIAQGTATPNGVAQILARDRSHIPRHLWCAYRGLNFIGNKETSPSQILTTTEKLAVHNLRLLNKLKSDSCDDFNSEIKITGAVVAWSKYAAWQNYQAYYYRNFVLAKLEREYDVVEVFGDPLHNYKPQIKVAKQNNLENYAARIDELNVGRVLSGKLPTRSAFLYEDSYKKRDRQKLPVESTGEIDLKEAKYRLYLEQTYGSNNINPQLIIKDIQGILSKIELHYYLGEEVSLFKRERSKLKGFLGDRAWGALINKVDLLKSLEIERFTNPDLEFSSSSLGDWFKKLSCYQRDLKKYFGFKFGLGEQPIKVAQRMLKFFLDIKLTFVGKRGKRGEQERFYQGYKLSSDRASIFEYWKSKNQISTA